jgi:hypothetical protein
MPLSDHEQQILADIEARLRAEDPKLARSVGSTTVAAHARRQVRVATAVAVAGFVLLLAGIANIVVGMVGFGLILAAVFYGAGQLQRLRTATPRPAGEHRGPLGRDLDSGRRRDTDA